MKNNVAKYYVHMIMTSIVAMLASGSILQSFLMEAGLGEESVNILTSLMQMVQVAVMVGFSKKMDGSQKIVEISAYSRLLDLPLIIFLIFVSFTLPENKNMLFIITMILMVIYGVGIGITNISSYKLPYLVIDLNQYGKITALAGVLSGVLTFFLSAGVSYAQESFNYFSVMKGVFLLAIISLIIYVISTAAMKGNYEMVKADAEEKKKTNILSYKPFSYLIIPNLLRGFNAGIIGISVTVGYYVKLIDGAAASLMVGVSTIATILGCFVYANISQKVKDGNTLLISSIAVCLAMPLMLLGSRTGIFITFYAVTFFFYNIINYAVPAAVVKFVDYDIAGQYSAGRMILHTAGMALAGFVCVAMFKLIGPLTTMIFAGACQLVSGLGYYVFLKRRRQ